VPGEEQLPRPHELDAELVGAAKSADPQLFERRFAKLLEFVRSGELLEDAQLGASDAVLPPPDVSLAEATSYFSTEVPIPS
jgi:hypothetical protein